MWCDLTGCVRRWNGCHSQLSYYHERVMWWLLIRFLVSLPFKQLDMMNFWPKKRYCCFCSDVVMVAWKILKDKFLKYWIKCVLKAPSHFEITRASPLLQPTFFLLASFLVAVAIFGLGVPRSFPKLWRLSKSKPPLLIRLESPLLNKM